MLVVKSVDLNRYDLVLTLFETLILRTEIWY